MNSPKRSDEHRRSRILFWYDTAFLIYWILSIVAFVPVWLELMFSERTLSSVIILASNILLAAAFFGNCYLHRKWGKLSENGSLLQNMIAFLGRLAGGAMTIFALFSIGFLLHFALSYRSLMS